MTNIFSSIDHQWIPKSERKRILCHVVYFKHVCSHRCSKKYTRCRKSGDKRTKRVVLKIFNSIKKAPRRRGFFILKNPTDQNAAKNYQQLFQKSGLKKALRHRQKIFTTTNHSEWSKNQSCRICHDLTPNPSPKGEGDGAISLFESCLKPFDVFKWQIEN